MDFAVERWLSFRKSNKKNATGTSQPATEAGEPKRERRARETFTDLLPWMEYLQESGTFLLEDGRSVAVVWEIDPVGTEGSTQQYKMQIRDKAINIVADTIPEHNHNPWVLQVFVKDEPELTEFFETHKKYRFGEAVGSAYTAHFDEQLGRHLKAICKPNGYFTEDNISGNRWRGKQRRIRFVLYRMKGKEKMAADFLPEDEVNELAAKLESAFANGGIRARRYGGKDFYNWMLLWFNPKPELTDGDVSRLLELAPYPGDDEAPYGRDFSDMLCLTLPYADQKKGIFYFDGLPHTVVTTNGFRRKPKVGHFTGEQSTSKTAFTHFDRMPEHTVMAMAITFVPQDTVADHVQSIEKASVGDRTEAELAAEQARAVKRKMGRGDVLYPMELVFYVRGDDIRDLRRRCNQVNTLLLSADVTPIGRDDELLLTDRYIAMLPMRFRPELNKYNRRSRYTFGTHLASALPVYGRTTGTGHPGITVFNRGAEPLTFDPLHRLDRKKNAHMLVIGPTGAGKSSLLVWLIMQMVAIYRPRLYIVEAGNSFGLLAADFKRHGLDVFATSLTLNNDVSLPPFVDALRLFDDTPIVDVEDVAVSTGDDDTAEDIDDEDIDGTRDILGEMENAARLMITGGEDKEEARLTQSDRRVIREALYNAAVAVRERGGDLVRPVDVSNAMLEASNDEALTDGRRDRIREMADSVALFTGSKSLAGHLFNRKGTHWPDADVTLVDLGTLAREGYEGELALAYISLLTHIHNVVERNQNSPRMTLVVKDEDHLTSINPLLVRSVVKITKMWRKLGAWYWAATQSLEDFPDAAKRMLNMMEWWLCLVMPKEEIDHIARFKELTDEQKRMLLEARKEPGKYIEGVLLSDELQTLFRVVPPALALALALTENEEKAERAQLMREFDLSDPLDAAYKVAERLEEER